MRMLTSALTALVVALILTSCSGEPESAPPASPTPSEIVASPTPEPSESTTPQTETAEEFIRRWPVVETAMLNTGDTAEYRAFASKRCSACMGLAEQVENIYSSGGMIETKVWRIKAIDRVSGKSAPEVFVVRTLAYPTVYRESADAPTKRLGGGPVNHQVTLKEADSGWVLLDTVDVGSS